MKNNVYAFLFALVAAPGAGETKGIFVQGGTYSPPPQGGYIPKTRFSSRMRLVFVAGVEGTGHHYLVGALENMYAQHSDLVHLVECRMAAPYSVFDSMTESPSYYAKARDLARRDMRKLAQHQQQDNDESAVRLGALATLQVANATNNADDCDNVGILSYPNNAGKNKVFKYTDLGMLAEVAEAEGVDLRVVYLKRAAKDIIIADTRHRHFQDGLGDKRKTTRKQRYMEYMRVLFTDISVMHAMLAELGPEFVVCHDFEDMGSAEQVSEIAKFVAPNPEVQAMLEDSLMKVALPRGGAGEDPLDAEDAEVAARLQRKLDVLESSLCMKS